VERHSPRIISACFVGLAVYVAVDAGHALWSRDAPARTIPGIIVASLSVVVMPLLARAKRRVASGLGSRVRSSDRHCAWFTRWQNGVADLRLSGAGLIGAARTK
jgi:divalent metal cation (Fe/Co/Zn/Cd) transporter